MKCYSSWETLLSSFNVFEWLDLFCTRLKDSSLPYAIIFHQFKNIWLISTGAVFAVEAGEDFSLVSNISQ